MRIAGRSDDGDARPDRTDETAAQDAASLGVPADGVDAYPPAPTALHDDAPHGETSPDDPGHDDPGHDDPGHDDPGHDDPGHDEAAPLPLDVSNYDSDTLILDPLLSDEPIDLAAVHADDALIDALGGGDVDAARALVDGDDPLIAMLAAWASTVRPDLPETTPERPPLRVVEALEPAAAADPVAIAEPVGADRPGAGAAAGLAAVVPLVVPTCSGAAPEVPEIPADVPVPADRTTPTVPADAAGTGPDGTGTTGTTGTDGAVTGSVGAPLRRLALPGRGVLDRTRTMRTRMTSSGRPLPVGHPLYRAAVVIVAAVLGVSAAAATGGTAHPGDAGFAMTRVFFAERAKSLEAAQVVATGLARAREYLDRRQPALAAQELAAVSVALPQVREEEGRTELVDQQQVLAAAIASTPAVRADPRLNGPPPPPDGRTPDTSVLAEGAPADTGTPSDAATPGSATPDSATTDSANASSAADAGPSDSSGPAGIVTKPGHGDTSTSGGASTPDTASTDPASTSAGTSGATSSGTTTSSGSTSSSEAATSSGAVTSTVGGSTDEGTVTVGGTSGTGASGTGGGSSGSSVTRTSAPTTTSPTTSSTRARPRRPSHPAPPPPAGGAPVTGAGSGSVTVGSAHRADSRIGAAITVRPASHDESQSAPAVLDVAPDQTSTPARAAGSVTAEPAGASYAGAQPAEAQPADALSAEADAADPDAAALPVVVTTVPPPAPLTTGSDEQTGTAPSAKASPEPGAAAREGDPNQAPDAAPPQAITDADRSGAPDGTAHRARRHAVPGHGPVGGARLVGGEVRIRTAAE